MDGAHQHQHGLLQQLVPVCEQDQVLLQLQQLQHQHMHQPHHEPQHEDSDDMDYETFQALCAAGGAEVGGQQCKVRSFQALLAC